MYLISADCHTNYGLSVSTTVVGDTDLVKTYQALIGYPIYFSRLKGTYTEVSGCIQEADLHIVPLPSEAGTLLLKRVGTHLSGEDFLAHLYVDVYYDDLLQHLASRLTEAQRVALTAWMQASGRFEPSFHAPSIVSGLAQFIPFHLILTWHAARTISPHTLDEVIDNELVRLFAPLP